MIYLLLFIVEKRNGHICMSDKCPAKSRILESRGYL